MSNQKNKAIFLEGSLMRHVSVMSFTSSVGLMAIFAVDFVDMIFISMIGNDALAAAVGYAATILFFTNAINIGLSIAAGTLVAQAVGSNHAERAKEYGTNVTIFGVLIGVAVPCFALPYMPQILGMLGATGDVADLAINYLWILMPSMAFMSVAMTAMAILRAHGDARRPMMAMLIGGTVNAVLDPLFIFTFGLGLEGAALASVVARVCILFLCLRPLFRVYDGFARPAFAPIKRDIIAITSLAGPAVLANVATPVGSALVTREMSKFGTDAIAGMAVVGRLVPVAFAVVLALSGAIGPIVGQNFGAGRMDRVKEAFVVGLKFVGIYVLFASLVLFLLRGQVAGLFNAEGLSKELIFLFCGPLALFYFFDGALYASNASFNNLKHPSYSAWLNWGRNTVGILPFVLVGAYLFGAKGVLIGQAVGGVLFSVVAVILAYRVMGKVKPDGDEAGDSFSQEKRMHTLSGRMRL